MRSGGHFLTIFGFIAAIVLAGTVLLVICAAAVQNDNYSISMVGTDQVTVPFQAPMNPKFLEYQNRMQNNVEPFLPQTVTINNANGSTSIVFVSGVIPSPIDMTHTTGQQIRPAYSYPILGAAYPSSFDLRTQSKVTPVRDQGSAGSCWAHASVASLESYLLPGESPDFSENNMKNTLAVTYTDGFNRTWNGGGNEWMATAYLTRWSGPIRESDDPYNADSGSSPSGLNPVKHVQNVYFLPHRANSTDNDNIKYALMTWGAVTASINFLNPYYRDENYAFYNNANATCNHAITLVGWNDAYSKTNFATQPPGDGAFIARNSWGSGWGNQGYFYISYYDITVGNVRNAIFTSEPVSNYDRVYSYDPLGWTSNLGYGSPTAQFANIFTAQSDETLKAVGFFTPTSNTDYIISIYISPNNGPINSGGYATRTTGTIASPGYHTVTIPDVNLTAGQKYSIVVSATTPGYNFPIPIEQFLNNYSNHATAHAGESYVSSSGTTWTDLTSISGYSTSNVCLKGYTKSASSAFGSEGVAIFRNSTGYWYFDNNLDGSIDKSFRYGNPTDQIITGDWDGDGKEGIALFRPSTGYWYFDYNLDGSVDKSFRYGNPTDQIIAGDWDGDEKDGIALFRPSTGYWYFDYNLDGIVNKSIRYGNPTDQIVKGNWQGAGQDGIALFRPSTGYWYFDYNLDGSVDKSFRFGNPTDRIIAGDWDGDEKDGIALFRPSTGYWYLDNNLDGTVDKSFRFGGSTDQIIKGTWI